MQYIHSRLKQLGHNVDITYCRLEDVDHIHEDLRRLDRKNKNTIKNFVLDISSQAALRSVLYQVGILLTKSGWSKVKPFLVN